MGHTYVKVKVYSADLSKFQEPSLPVDTGSTYSWIAKNVLNGLGVKPLRKQMFKTIDGKLLERQVGEAPVEYISQRVTTVVVFAEENDTEVLGVHALEGLALEIDPLTKELRKVKVLLAV